MTGRMTMRDPNQFRIVRRGYDTAQVDGFLDEYERWGESALRHIKALEARLPGHDPNPRTAGRDPEEANQLGGKAQADKAEAERVAAEIVESAQARAREISEAAERDQKKAAQSLAEACQKAERLVDDVKVASDALMRSIKDSSHTCFEDLHRQIQSLEEQRRAT